MTTAIAEKTIPLVMTCPTGCANKRVVKCWTHKSCGDQVFLKGNGNLLCLNNCLEKSICDWRFACELHQGEYRKVEFNALIDALGCAMRSTKAFFKGDKEGLLFLRTIQDNIYEKLE